MLAEKTFDTGTVKIHYAEGPAHGRPLILIHGTTSRWQGFLPILPQLSFRYHTYALDLRGHGSSGRVPGAYRFVDYAEDIMHFLREQVREPAALLGHSLGGAIAAQVAADAPDLTYALILEEPANPIVRERGEVNEAFTSRIRSWYDLLVAEPPLEEIRAFTASQSPNAAAPDQLAWAKSMSQTDPGVLYDVFTDRAIEV